MGFLDKILRNEKKNNKDGEIFSPIEGKIVNLANVPDEVFASGVMGKGVAIIPSQEIVVSPIEGEVTSLFPTGHAIGLKAKSGEEILIHIGINTVEMRGAGFTTLVKEGQKVKVGEKLIEFQIKKIEDGGYNPIIMIILTNSNEFNEIKPITQAYVNTGDLLISVK